MSSEMPTARSEDVGQPCADLEPVKRLLLSRSVEQAEQLCRQVLDAQPDCAEAHHLLGVALLRRGETEPAFESLRQAVALEPENSVCHNTLGAALASVRRFEEAAECFRQAHRGRPTSGSPVFRILGHERLRVPEWRTRFGKTHVRCEKSQLGKLIVRG